MQIGILRKGFQINGNVHTVKIPKNTGVIFNSLPEPTIEFQGKHVRLHKINGKWFAEIGGIMLEFHYDENRPPYPLSFFDKPSLMKPKI
jgi:hypothetical protein